jgi:hypothetical protein
MSGARGSHTKELERMITGPKITMRAPESNVDKMFVYVDGEERVLAPGQSTQTFGYEIMIIGKRADDGCHVSIG